MWKVPENTVLRKVLGACKGRESASRFHKRELAHAVKVLIEAVALIEAVREAVLVLVKAVRVLLCEWANSVLLSFCFNELQSVRLTTLIKKKIKFSSYIGKFRVEQLQSHILGRAS
jgi:hypothetical protein